MLKILAFIITCFFFIGVTTAQTINQNRKKLDVIRVDAPPKIDGKLDDAAWKNVPAAKDFVMMRPDNGKAEPDTHKTVVKLVYDDNAIYISAKMYDPEPSKIPAEFTNRDNIGNSDFFLITINPNDDGQNPFEFIVTSSGAQADSKVSNGNEDFNWSAVWDSDFSINEDSWVVEMKIPYRALRFANVPVQSWGINYHRKVLNLNAQFTWNHIDNQQGNWTQYDGLYENFTNIKPPTRLNFYPYASATMTTKDGNTDFDWSVGMDVKYGITENFTLDATLIPDFSQVGFDNVTLNLGPFEQQFTEQRQFFTEGTELFSKGNLFYSRRIGGRPIDQFSNERKDDDEFVNGKKINDEVIDVPDKVQMLNAIKISGRTKGGLGIGFFNAITEKTEATVERTKQTINGLDTISNVSTYKTTVNPFSNYNIMVLDQQFNQNSSITLINTNVTRDGRFRDANVTGLLWHVEDKKSRYNIDGSFKMSSISDDEDNPNTGYTFDTSIGKHSGNWRGEIGYNFENKDYNPNDMGILFSNNEQAIYGFVGYRLLKPKGIFNNYRINVFYDINFLHNPGTYVGTNVSLSFGADTKKRFSFGGNLNYSTERKDFFEPRQGTTSGVFFNRPERLNVNHWGSTDYRKKFAIDYDWYYTFYKNNPKEDYGFRVSPRYRFTNKFSLIYGFRYGKTNNGQGYVTKIDEDDVEEKPLLAPLKNHIIFGQRDWDTYDNSLTGKYTFSTKSAASLSFRHNWSKVPYLGLFYSLNEDNGELVSNNYQGEHDKNFNSWNLDLNYQWQFAPGSQLIFFYRNSIRPDHDFAPANIDFKDNISKLFDQSMQHRFSVRLVYFIDYNNIKNII
uniref:Hydrolase n=1 Tax=Tenacibaculum sp. Pbs-1 TaxID=3238748 RepID=A0AB33KVK8_9FLAO